MKDPRAAAFVTAALSGRLNRRKVLTHGLQLGLASPLITALMTHAPIASAAPAAVPRGRLAAQTSSGTFTALITSGTDDIDPHSSYTTLSSTVALGLYEMLIQLNGSSTDEFEPMLAQEWESNADGSVYTFRLAPNALFHDGTPCDAQAVKDSFTRFLLLELGPVNVISRFVQNPDQMEVVDPTTIRFNLGRPQPLFLAAMASQYGPFIVSPTAVQENKTDDDPWAHEWFLANAVGSGPYKLDQNSLNEGLVMSKFDDYHGGWDGNHFDQIVLRVVPETATRRQLLEQGEADAATFSLTPEDLEALKINPDVQVLIYDTTDVTWIQMNAPRMKTKEVRQGFSYAFPYQEVIDGAFSGLLKRSGPIPDTVRGFDPNVFLYQTDMAKAKELILAGGFKEGDSFDYMFDANDPFEPTVAQLFQANLAQIGFNLELTAVDSAAKDSLIFGDSPAEERPMFVDYEWWPDYNDPWNHLAPNFLESSSGGGGSNTGYWVNPRFEEIMTEAEQYTDENRLLELMKEAQNILTEQDPPAIYEGLVKYYTVLRANILGYYANPIYLAAYPFYKMSRAVT